MRVAILDDYQQVSLASTDWSAVRSRAEVDVFAKHIASTGALVSAQEHGSVGEEFIRLLHKLTSGNPFFIDETLRGLLTGTKIGDNLVITIAWCVGVAVLSYAWSRRLYEREPKPL